MDKAVRHLYEFGPFVLDPGERLLRHGAARMDLRDGEDGARYIETVPKRGYRFVGEVREFEPSNGHGNGHNRATRLEPAPSGNDLGPSAFSVATAGSRSEADL